MYRLDRFVIKKSTNSYESGCSTTASQSPHVPSVSVNTTSLEFIINEINSDPGDQKLIEKYDPSI